MSAHNPRRPSKFNLTVLIIILNYLFCCSLTLIDRNDGDSLFRLLLLVQLICLKTELLLLHLLMMDEMLRMMVNIDVFVVDTMIPAVMMMMLR